MGRSSMTPKNNAERIRNLETKIHQLKVNQTFLKLDILDLFKLTKKHIDLRQPISKNGMSKNE